MALSTMYPAMPGSPKTALAADITAAATSMTVADASALPAAPNIAVIGADENAEVVTYTSIAGSTVSGLVRGLGGTTASAWTAGTEVARNVTSLDHDTFLDNITALNTDKQDTLTFDATPTESSTNPVESGGVYDALATKQDTLTFDDTPSTLSNNPVKSGGVKTYVDDQILYFSGITVTTNAEMFRITDDKITTDTIVLECVFEDPINISSDITWTSYNGYIAFTGTCTAATTANVVLGRKGN